MTTSEERMRILQMIQDGTISAEDGIRLMDSIEKSKKVTGSEEPAADKSQMARFFRIRVTDTNTGKTRVNVRLPVSVVNSGLKMGARFAPAVDGLNTADLMQFIREGTIGKIVDVYDDEDGEHVEVFLE
jgi:hypothetical protein